jgi:hypothetical protein
VAFFFFHFIDTPSKDDFREQYVLFGKKSNGDEWFGSWYMHDVQVRGVFNHTVMWSPVARSRQFVWARHEWKEEERDMFMNHVICV